MNEELVSLSLFTSNIEDSKTKDITSWSIAFILFCYFIVYRLLNQLKGAVQIIRCTEKQNFLFLLLILRLLFKKKIYFNLIFVWSLRSSTNVVIHRGLFTLTHMYKSVAI